MEYNPKHDIDSITYLKKQWDDADKAGETEKKKKIAQSGRIYYERLRGNGYNTVANNLSQRGFEDAVKYAKDYYTKTGRSQFRDYMYNKGKEYGMNQADIDKLIGWDDTTGEVRFGGKNIGKPDGIADNRSYFKTDYMDNVWNDYVKSNNINRTNEQDAAILRSDIKDKYDKLFNMTLDNNKNYLQEEKDFRDTVLKYNPYESSVGESAKKYFDYLGDEASRNAIADGAASNGGNIDSFAAANAARQQLAFDTAAFNAIQQDFQYRIGTMKDSLSRIGVQMGAREDSARSTIESQRDTGLAYDKMDEEKKLNAQNIENDKVANLATKAGVTGYIPTEWQNESNPYLDADGNVKNLNIDYNARITALEKEFADTTDEKTKADIKQEISWLNTARAIKAELPQYAKWANDRPIIHGAKERTSAFILDNKQLDNDLKKNENDNATDRYISDNSLTASKYSDDKNLEGIQDTNKAAITKAGMDNASAENIAKIEASSNKYDTDANLSLATMQLAATSDTPSLTFKEVENLLKAGETSQSVIDMYNKYTNSKYTTDNPPPIVNSGSSSSSSSSGSSKKKSTVTNTVVKDIAKMLNDDYQEKYGVNAVKTKGYGTYQLDNAESSYVINRIANSAFTDDEKAELFNRFNITQDQLYDFSKDKHYK